MSAKDITEPAAGMPSVVPEQAPTPLSLLSQAIQQGIDAESLERLVGLQERILDRQAEAAFNVAMAQFQAECPPIGTSATGTAGGGSSYNFAQFPHVMRVIKPHLIAAGLSLSFDQIPVDASHDRIVCIVSHVEGHSRERGFKIPTTSKAGMSDQQKSGSAASHGKRYALLLALALDAGDVDNDAAEDVEPITAEQAADLEALITEVGANRERFLVWARVADLTELAASRYPAAVAALEARRGR